MQEMEITDRQVKRMIIIETFAGGALFMPVAAAGVKDGVVMTMIMGILVAFVFGAFFIWVSGRQGYFAGVQAADGRLIHLLYALRFFLRSVIYLLVFVEMIKKFLLPESGRIMIAIPVVIVACYACLRTLVGRARLIELLFWWGLVPVILIWLLSLPGWDWELLASQRFAAVGVRPGQTLYRVYEMMLLYLPFEGILYFMPAAKCAEAEDAIQQEKADSENSESGDTAKVQRQRSAYYGLCIGLLLTIAVFCMAFFTIGEHGLRVDTFSVCSMLQTVQAPGNVVARLDILAMPFLMIGLFVLYSGSVFYGCKALEKVWIPKLASKYHWLVPAAISVALIIVLLFLTDFQAVIVWYVEYAVWIDIPLAIILPILCMLGMGKRSKILIIFLMVFLSLTACVRVDIEDQDYVLMLGVDDCDDELKRMDTDYVYSVAMADMEGYKAETGESVKMKTAVGKRDSLMVFRDSYSRNHATQMDFGHVKLVLFQEDLLEQPKRMAELLATWEEQDILSATVMVAATKEDAEDFIELDEESELVLSVAIVDMLEKEGNVAVTLQDLHLAYGEGEALVLPVLEISEEEEFPEIVSYVKIKNPVLEYTNTGRNNP